jgi:flagella synthesis protein FlgN
VSEDAGPEASPIRPDPESSARLREALERQIALAGDLRQVLEAEGQALGKRDADTLETLAQRKGALVRELEALGLARAEALGPAASQANPGRVAERLAQGGASELSTLWRRGDALLRDCRERNEVNGRTITLLGAYAERALRVLLGPSEHGEVYGRAGSTRRAAVSRYHTRV